MSIRVTQNSMYGTMTSQMQKSLASYMESNEQGSTQKKINRPSDDPAGMYRVLMTRDDINATKQYQSNVDTAKGWLSLADSVLGTQVSNQLTRLKSLAEQASTGTYSAENREQIAFEARQIFGEMLNLANTEFEGKSIFAGHRYDVNAYEEKLGLCSWDEKWNAAIQSGEFTVEGASNHSIMIQFTEDGALGDDPPPSFRWSDDGGDTWHSDGTYEMGATLDMGLTDTVPPTRNTVPAVKLNLGNGVVLTMKEGLEVSAADTALGPGADNGTLVYVRPQAAYQGDDEDTPPEMTIMGGPAGMKAVAQGAFSGSVLLRLDTGDGNAASYDLKNAPGTTVHYSYSTDSGATWVAAVATTSNDGKLHLPVPSGYVDVDMADATDGSGAETSVLAAGTQLLVRPHRAGLNLEIMKDTYIPINNVGKDIFGGEYDGRPVLPEAEDLFGMVGDFVAYLENNNQEGCQRTLARIATVQEHILTETARIGGLENRVSTASDVLSFQKLDQEERLSYIEDIDLTELLTKLTRQQMTYQTVLQSSSKIMQMSLANYI